MTIINIICSDSLEEKKEKYDKRQIDYQCSLTFIFSLKALGSTFSTSTPNLCLNCEDGERKSEKLRRRVAQKEEEKKMPVPDKDEKKAENGNDTCIEQEHLLTE